MSNHEDDMTAHELPLEMSREHHKYANVESEFRYLPYVDTEGDDDDDDMHILPPVTKSDKTGHAMAHAVVCAVESRYHKQRRRCYPPKSMWSCSVKSLIQTMTARTKKEGNWSIKSISEAISESGIGLTVDEGSSDQPVQPGPKYRGVYLQTLDNEPQVFDQIHENGPIIALIRPLKEDFEDWSPELAEKRVYSGSSMETEFSIETSHAVALIGTGCFSDGSRYLIAQNCYGEEWGDKGVFRMMPEDVVKFVAPIIS